MIQDAWLSEQVQRHNVFADRVLTRFREVLGEAEHEINAILQTEALDVAPLAAALSVIKSRSEGLITKLDDASEQIEQTIDGSDRDDERFLVEAREAERAVRRRRTAAAAEIRFGQQRFEAKKQADAARALGIMAQAELKPNVCASCNAPFQPVMIAQPTNVSCPYCRAVNVVRPGPATVAYYSRGVEALAREAHDVEWTAMMVAQEFYQQRRHQTEDEFASYAEAYRIYWHAYYRKLGELNPSLQPQYLSQAVQGKEKWLQSEAQMVGGTQSRTVMLDGLRLATQSNTTALIAWSQQVAALPFGPAGVGGPGYWLELLAEAAYERGQDKLVDSILEAWYKVARVADSFKRWKKDQLQSLALVIAR